MGFEVRAWGSEFRVSGFGFRIQNSGCRVQGSGLKFEGARFRVWFLGLNQFAEAWIVQARERSEFAHETRGRLLRVH